MYSAVLVTFLAPHGRLACELDLGQHGLAVQWVVEGQRYGLAAYLGVSVKPALSHERDRQCCAGGFLSAGPELLQLQHQPLVVNRRVLQVGREQSLATLDALLEAANLLLKGGTHELVNQLIVVAHTPVLQMQCIRHWSV